MNPPSYFPAFHPLQPQPSYHPLQPPPSYHPLHPPPAAPNSIYPFDLSHPSQYEAPPSSSSASTSSTTTTAGAAATFYSDIPSALSALTSLLQLTRTTLNSISHFLPTPRNSSTALLPCPFNPNHLIPASSLFSHYISCPSSKCPLSADHLLHSLHYPHTLPSSATNLSTQPLESPNSSDLCFSLENFLNSTNNFFYSDCPGPVRVDSSNNDTSDSPPILTLPRFLHTLACTNESIDLTGLYVESIKLLPSEIWAVREEMNSWVDYPVSYSCSVLRIILGLGTTSLSNLLKWIIMNSPNYGVIIDLAMTDHIVLLFKLCLKGIITEATGFASSFFTEEVVEEELCGDKREFDCPVLTSTLRWLGFQLSVLYGESNGIFFTINILKQCVLDSAWNSLVFPMAGEPMDSPNLIELGSKLEMPIGKIESVERRIEENGKGINNSSISVSQVAASVAALHERSWLERKIKALRDPQLLTAYQRMVEHEYISKRANDERQKHPDYRPVIEHDGLLLHQTQNQEPNRIKTREELLAEERDYKRRRMSYRGKKMKRSTTQVMRDIIDEYMDQIKQASNAAKGANEDLFDNSLDVIVSEKYQSTFRASHVDSDEAHRRDHGSTDYENKYLGKDKQHRHDSLKHHKLVKNERSIKTARHDGREYSRSPDRWPRSERSIHKDRHDRNEYFRNSGRQNSRYHSQGYKTNQVVTDTTNEKLPQSSDKSCSMSYGQKSHHGEENEHYSERRDKYTEKKLEQRRSTSSHIEFKDRYVP